MEIKWGVSELIHLPLSTIVTSNGLDVVAIC